MGTYSLHLRHHTPSFLIQYILQHGRVFLLEIPGDAPGDPIGDAHVGDHGVDAAGGREHARVRDVQVLRLPGPAIRVHDALVRARAHLTRAHLVRGREADVGRVEVGVLESPDPGREGWVVDALVEVVPLHLRLGGGGFWLGGAHERGHVLD